MAMKERHSGPWEKWKTFWKTYSPYFLDIWQYVAFIVVFIIAACIFL